MKKKFTNNSVIKVDNNVVKKLIKTLKPEVKRAIDFSYNRIIKFHSKQKVRKNILLKVEIL